MKFSFAGHAKSLAVSVLILLFSLTATMAANAASFNFNNPVGGGNYPTCSGGTWSSSGSTYTCTGSITLASGDNMLPSNGITVIANNGFTLSGNNTIGSAANNVNLQTAWTGITAGSGVAIYGNVAVTGGSIVLQGGSVSGSVSSNCCAISTTNTNISGGISSSSNSVTINGGTISGAISSSGGGGISISNATVTSGSITAGTVPIVISNSTIGSVASPVTITGSNTVTISSSSTVYGSITAGAWPGTVVVDGSSSVVGNCVPNHARCEGVTFPANQCAADRFGDDLVCTANDVAITGMQVVGDTTSCVGGTFVTLDLQMSVNFAVPDRWDIGIFISNDGKNPETRAANGGAATCAVSVLPTASPFLNLDGGATGDTCGDGNGSIGGGTGTGIHYMSNVTVPCQSLAGASGQLYIPFVVSWDNQQSPSGALCTSNLNPVPNTKSKCNAPTVVQGSVGVVVLPSITKTDNQAKVNGQSQVFSGTASTYQITVTNSTGVAISNVNFKDPAVSGIDVTNVSCAASSGASCPAGTSATLKSAMQGSGLTLPTMAAGSSLTFTVTATLTGTPGNVRTNTATVTVGGQTNTASDTAIIVDTFALLPTTQAKSGDSGALVPYTYTLYNFGNSAATFSLSAVSSKWSSTVSPTSVTVPAGGSTNITVTVTVGNGALGAVDITTLTATSPSYPGKTATATAVTTKTAVLTLTPSNTGSAGAGSYVYYSHRVQNNDASSKAVALTPSFTSGTCTGWSSTLLKADKSSLTSPVTLAASGGYLDFLLRVYVAPGAAQNSTCTATLTAAYTSGTANSVSVTDITTVKRLMLYEDAGYSVAQDTYPVGNRVYAQTYGLTPNVNYYYEFLDPAGNVVCRDPSSGSTFNVGTTWTTSCLIPSAGPLGTWTARIFNTTNTVTPFASEPFYVGPDHVKASYTGGTVTLNTDVAIDLALHDKTNHVVPFDTSGNLVKGGGAEEALFITVTVSGSAQIVSTTLTNASISGQTVTGRLNSTTGTAKLTLRNTVAEVVTVTPASANGKLIGSTVRDEPTTVTFFGVAGPHHLRIEHGSTGLTCQREAVVFKACAGADCSSPYTGGDVALNLSPAGQWYVAAAGGTVLPNPQTIPASGSLTLYLQQPTPATVSVNAAVASGPTPSGLPAVTCNDDTTAAPCGITFSDAGLIFTDNTAPGLPKDILTRTAGEISGQLYVRAAKNDGTGQCVSAVSGGVATLGHVCKIPDTCTPGTWLTTTGTLTFDANGYAPFKFTYNDAGKILLRASATSSTGATLTGDSNEFVVKPAALCVYSTALSNCATADENCSKVKKAGETFNLTVAAVRAGYDCANAGTYVTPNYKAIEITLGHILVAPAGPSEGSVGVNEMNISSAGWATVDQSISEVGVFRFSATPPTPYIDLGVDIGGPFWSGNFGRFIPDHFTITPGTLAPACGSFTYYGQDGFSTPFSITAQRGSCTETCTDLTSAACICTTKNYSGNTDWARLDLTSWSSLGLTAAPLPAGTSLSGSTNHPPVGSWTNGVASFTTPLWSIVSRPTSPVAPTTVTVSALPVDTDGVTMPVAVTLGTALLRFGILRLENAYGSELLPIRVPVRAMFCNAVSGANCTEWRTNTDDTCTRFQSGDAVLDSTSYKGTLSSSNFSIASNWNDAQSRTDPIGTGSGVTGGKGVIVLNRPLNNATGSVDLTLTGIPDWLKGGAGTPWPEVPVARIKFGSPKAPYIYLRERY